MSSCDIIAKQKEGQMNKLLLFFVLRLAGHRRHERCLQDQRLNQFIGESTVDLLFPRDFVKLNMLRFSVFSFVVPLINDVSEDNMKNNY